MRKAPSDPSAALVKTSSAPYACKICLRSGDAFSGKHSFTGYPIAAQIIAYAMPVFPLVESSSVLPATSSPRSSPSRIMFNAGRSFTEPPGFKNSAFAHTSARPREASPIRSSGVCPIRLSNPASAAISVAVILFPV